YMENILRYVFDRRTQRALIALEDSFYLFEDPDIAVFTQWQYTSAANAEFFVGNHGLLRDFFYLSKTIAYRAGPIGGVKGERVGRRFVVRQSGLRVHEIL